MKDGRVFLFDHCRFTFSFSVDTRKRLNFVSDSGQVPAYVEQPPPYSSSERDQPVVPSIATKVTPE